MPATLPLIPSVPFYRVGTTMEDTQYLLDIRWNGRDGAWYMDLLDQDASPIASGLKLVLGAAVGSQSVDSRFPPGAITLLDTSGNEADATFDDMGTRVIVIYFTAAEMAE